MTTRSVAGAAMLAAFIAAACAGSAVPGVPDAERHGYGEGPAGSALPALAAPAALATLDPLPGEERLGPLHRITDRGSNAEAYFSADGRRLIFQATRPGESECDQIFTLDLETGGEPRLVSTGSGRTTCGYFFPSGDRIVYSSTHHVDPACPPPPDRSRGYVWPLHPYDIFTARPDGSDLRRLTDNPGYDAEATISPDGQQIVFASHRDGDVNIYVMDADGGHLRQLTHDEGYAGGPFFSPDGSRIVYRAYHPTDPAELEEYRDLLRQRLVRPSRVELYVMDADGSNRRQITDNGAANFAPFFHPDGRRIIFSSNLHDPEGRRFSLYMIDDDGGNLERITYHDGFDSFPMFTRDGLRLVFASNRAATDPRGYDIFVADWHDGGVGEGGP